MSPFGGVPIYDAVLLKMRPPPSPSPLLCIVIINKTHGVPPPYAEDKRITVLGLFHQSGEPW
jgi:hypothetical protein